MKKRMFIYILGLIILLSTGLMAKPQAVFACSCAGPISAEQQVQDEFERKTAIFEGVVLQVTQPRQKIVMSSANLVKVTFDVSRVWKGELGRKAVVYTAMSSASCGIESFQVGTNYIVSAYKDSEPLETNICDLTKPVASAGAELAFLGEGHAPTDLGPETINSSKVSTMSLIVAIATVIIGGTIIGVILRRRRSGS